jgi:hypothetical protein
MSNDTKYHKGNIVRVIKGCVLWAYNEKTKQAEPIYYNNDTIGSIGIISQANKSQKLDYYSLEPIIKKGVNLKHAWYHNDEFELLTINNLKLI